MKKFILAVSVALLAAPVFADSIQVMGNAVTGSPPGGYHIVNLGTGQTCKLKSSKITGAPHGCNYTLLLTSEGAPWQVSNRTQPGCSTACEP